MFGGGNVKLEKKGGLKLAVERRFPSWSKRSAGGPTIIVEPSASSLAAMEGGTTTWSGPPQLCRQVITPADDRATPGRRLSTAASTIRRNRWSLIRERLFPRWQSSAFKPDSSAERMAIPNRLGS